VEDLYNIGIRCAETPKKWVRIATVVEHAVDSSAELRLFDGEPKIEDCHQFGGHCVTMATIASLVYADKEYIKSMIRKSSTPGLYEVDLWKQGKRRTIYIDEYFPVGPIERLRYHKQRCIWPMLIILALGKMKYGCQVRSEKLILADGSFGYAYQPWPYLTGHKCHSNRTRFKESEMRKVFVDGCAMTMHFGGHQWVVCKVLDGGSLLIFDTNIKSNCEAAGRKKDKFDTYKKIPGYFTISLDYLRGQSAGDHYVRRSDFRKKQKHG